MAGSQTGREPGRQQPGWQSGRQQPGRLAARQAGSQAGWQPGRKADSKGIRINEAAREVDSQPGS